VKAKGVFTIDGVASIVDLDLDTILDDLDGIFEGGFEYTNEQWAFVLWGFWVELETDIKTESMIGEFDTNIDLKLAILDAAVARRLGQWPLGGSETADWAFDLLGGLRYWSIDIEVTEETPSGFDLSGSRKDDWVDPFVGGRFLFDFSEKLNASFRADIGGFGIGSASDLTWSFTAVGEWRLGRNTALLAGYRYLNVDSWNTGSGDTETDYDFYLHGPIVGLTIIF
jgi:hypothetical protein